MTNFCRCGRPLITWLWGDTWVKKCSKHGMDYKSKEVKETQPRFSGKSRRGIKGGYEND